MAGGAKTKTRNLEAYQAYLDEKFSELKDSMATKECIEKLHTTIKDQNEKIQILESRIAIIERHISLLQNNVDENEQYSRRLCLRINGIPPVPEGQNESSESCLEKVKNVFNELGVDVPDVVIDRAHRIGRPRIVQGKRVHQVIVRFTTWRHRTLVYRARKNCAKYKVKLDLTKKKVDTIEKISEFLTRKKLGFAFADVNCRLCVKIGEEFHHINSEDDLHDIIREYDERSDTRIDTRSDTRSDTGDQQGNDDDDAEDADDDDDDNVNGANETNSR